MTTPDPHILCEEYTHFATLLDPHTAIKELSKKLNITPQTLIYQLVINGTQLPQTLMTGAGNKALKRRQQTT
ncbi:hypothetical protein G7Y31_06775 [Corynebacterium lizhenjunii]|uniref:Uncharacterized protein n=1 Tax=Corynebacterium lizhenjunii TaxID=2709394 RepID=A0A7T0KEM5_9CORY|nr:hypothetical protein [Corynebacterium lizhenjunii]QPK78288.1 hypothetical protein G7Y31_06775 [Corynebacterium lizhenjunii]